MKILLITHNPTISNNNMGKTFLTLFSEFKREELCQLYVHPTIPDVDVCNSYYRITDRQVLKSLIFGHPGGEIAHEDIVEQVDKQKNGTMPPPPPRGGTGSLSRMIRDAVWKISRWYSQELKAWLEREKPTCIFLAPGYSKFIYDIALRISADYALPIVTYICDDYYFVKQPKNWLGILQLFMLRKKINRLMNKTQRLVVISQELKETYQHHFGIDTDVVMTGTSLKHAKDFNGDRKVQKISYFGNLSAGRHLSLANIGQALEEFNRINKTHVVLQIYTSETSSDRLKVFDELLSVEICGFVSGKAFDDAFMASDVLVHTESFEKEEADMVKYSVSTKIADCLASGIPLLAYGPSDISSMKHLIRNECAVVATTQAELKEALYEVIFNNEKLMDTIERAKRTASEYHDKRGNSIKLRSVFSEIENKYLSC